MIQSGFVCLDAHPPYFLLFVVRVAGAVCSLDVHVWRTCHVQRATPSINWQPFVDCAILDLARIEVSEITLRAAQRTALNQLAHSRPWRYLLMISLAFSSTRYNTTTAGIKKTKGPVYHNRHMQFKFDPFLIFVDSFSLLSTFHGVYSVHATRRPSRAPR